ncbi:uncharacterized protein PG986_010718 [Apiospora aurea]|uniref:Lysine-specific metallo-endopeptidase domain-containing protein n=1 Tax=Apiospora aurea TaxID=335848 RepID=A0ABR1Q319_9PEZI
MFSNISASVPAQYDTAAIEAAFEQAIDLAENALDVLEHLYGPEQRIQQMVKHILGDDGDLPNKVEMAKNVFRDVSRYEKTPYPFLGPPFWENTDVVIYCDSSNYEAVTSSSGTQVLRYKAIGAIVSPQNWKNFEVCYDPNPEAGSLPMSITTPSDWFDLKGFTDASNLWAQTGGVGEHPKQGDFVRPRDNKPNTMDMCTWFLTKNKKEGWPELGEEIIEKVQDPSFVSGLQGDDKPIDTISTTLGPVILHELTHTTLGGRLEDKDNRNCYGWVCVGNLKDPSNSDPINMLGVVLKLWRLGVCVDGDGKLKSNTG